MRQSTSPPWMFRFHGKDKQERVALGAIKALSRGEASAHQQQVAFRYIVNVIAARDEQTFIPDELGGDRASAFLSGRRDVALALEKIVNLPMSAMTDLGDDE